MSRVSPQNLDRARQLAASKHLASNGYSASRHGHKALREAFHHHGELSEHLLARQLSQESWMLLTIHGSQGFPT